MTQLLEDPPARIRSQIKRTRVVGTKLLAAGNYAEAFEVYRQLLELMLGEQPPGHRWHKGEPLHNMGYARIKSGLLDHGLRWTLQAFVEDSLSRGERHPDVFDELQMPAAQSLRLYGYTEDELRSMAERIRTRAKRGTLVKAPKRSSSRMATSAEWNERSHRGPHRKVTPVCLADIWRSRRRLGPERAMSRVLS